MANTIDMQLMRYINLFEKISRVSTTNCFKYNNVIIFAVPNKDVSRAVGKNGVNVRRISEIFRKKIKIIPQPNGVEDLETFISNIVEPVGFTKVEIKEGIVFITGGKQNKAALIGRNRQREQELEDILKRFFSVSKVKIL